MEKVAFKLDSYHFIKATLDFNIPSEAELNIAFRPKGIFHSKDSRYDLNFDVIVRCKETETTVIIVSCVAYFSFNEHLAISEIPDFFYPNSIAIVFPYVRAFVSTVSLQANVQPVVLPTINLMGLKEELRRETKVID